jgi:UDP-N-acetylglucosamine--N-acetylmuramyl-(pentapeptide) pyrophosphoryl-undecaprenol N-acetylglucosamine transferase
VLIVVGPTAGHVYPALALAAAFRAAGPDAAVRFAGSLDGPAARILARHGCTLEAVAGSPLANVGVAGRLAAVPRVVAGMRQGRRILVAHGTRLVIGLGGYASGGVLLAARLAGVRTAIHEANVVPGIANRLLAPVVHRVWLGFAAAAGALPAGRALVTGNPVRADIAALAAEPRRAPERERAARVLVISSTRGEAFFAEQAPALLAAVERRGVAVEVLHQAGERPAAEVAHAYRRAGVKATVVPYVDEIASAYRWADLALTRAGGGTVAELAAAGLPALLVPLADAAGDHQAANAALAAAAGAGLTVREADWRGDALAGAVAALLADPRAWQAASAAARGLAVPDAAARIVADSEALMAGRW